MKKNLYKLLLIILPLTGCTNNEDEQPLPPVPPPTPSVNITAEDLIGTWESYYSEKVVTHFNPSTSKTTTYDGYRDISYDGFRTVFSKEADRYRAISYNLLDSVIEDARYVVEKDSVFFYWKNKEGKDMITKQHIREFNATEGIFKYDFTSRGNVEGQGNFEVKDIRAVRNVDIAPNAHPGVPKHKLDYENLSRGSWEIYAYSRYYGGVIDRPSSTHGLDSLNGTTYKFGIDKDGDKVCTIWSKTREDQWVKNTFPITIVDDVISYYFKEKADSDSITSIYMWVTDWKKRNGVDSFVDKKINRFEENVTIIVETEATLRRVADRPD